MTQSLKPLYQKTYIPTLFFTLGSATLLATIFLPFAEVDSKVFMLYQFIIHSIGENKIQLVILPVLLYPYLFAGLVIVLTVPPIHKIFSKIADTISLKVGTKKNSFPIKFIKGIYLFFILYTALLMNLYIYFGFYMSPLSGLLNYILLTFGFILLLIALFTAYHFRRMYKIQSDRCSGMLYLALSYSAQTVIYFSLATVILLRKDSSLLLGSYLSLFAAVIILFGMGLQYLRRKDSEPDSLIPLPEGDSDKVKQPGPPLQKKSRIIKL